MTFNVDTASCVTSQCPHFSIRALITLDDGTQEEVTKNVAGWSHGESGSTNFNIDRSVSIHTGMVTEVPYIESPEFICSDPTGA
jgi:hypothetical protein